MATATPEQAQHGRISIVVADILAEMLQDIIAHAQMPPKALYDRIVQTKDFNKKLSPEEWQVVNKLANPHKGFKVLDVSLAYRIVKHFRNTFVTKPTRNWGSNPTPTEVEIGDDVERIRRARNRYLHGLSINITEKTMSDFFKEFTEVAKRIDQYLNKTLESSFEKKLENFRTCSINENKTRETLKATSVVENQEGTTFLVHQQDKKVTVYCKKGLTAYIRQQISLTDEDAEEKAKLLNDFKDEINKDQLKFVFDKATEGSLLLYVEVIKSLLEQDSSLLIEISTFMDGISELIDLGPDEIIHVIITHPDVGNPQLMEEILAENNLPVQVRYASYNIELRSTLESIKGVNILIMKTYVEDNIQGNCLEDELTKFERGAKTTGTGNAVPPDLLPCDYTHAGTTMMYRQSYFQDKRAKVAVEEDQNYRVINADESFNLESSDNYMYISVTCASDSDYNSSTNSWSTGSSKSFVNEKSVQEILDFYVEYIPQPKTWFEAQKICEFNGGRLATDKDSNLTCAKLEGDIGSNKSSTFWSGMYTTYWVSREGCSNITRITEIPLSLSLSECFEVCRHQSTILHSFAYRPRDQKCVCLHSNARIKQHEGYNCSDFLKSNTTYLVYNDSVPYDVDWKMSQEKCKNSIPINITNICTEISHNDRKGIWLPIQKIALRTEISDGTKTTNVTTRQQTTTHVTSKKQTTTNLILKHTVTKDSTEYVKQTATSNTGNTLITTTNITTKPRRTTDVKMVHSVPSNSTAYWKDTPTSDTGLVVGGAVGTVLLIFAIVLIVVIKIRCKNATSINENDNFFALRNGKSPVYEDQHRKTGSSNDKMFNKKLYDEQCLTPCKIVPDESIRNEINNREDCKRHNYDYAVPIETKRTQSSPKQEDFKDGIDVESEYDILNKTPRSLNNTLEHNIYDTTIASRCESDPTYNTSTSIMSNQKNVDDMYDRL
ncbi:unnamed protein product [Mytilus coruscus]|uniref:Uncharacterized protein n=1 Tax=Mytilus coruscus TaxID=42192 RepID=A0A6J8CGE5_MYTCO|nr:unnamed protein product [Mytilus coruscus]